MHTTKDYGSKVFGKGLVIDREEHRLFMSEVPRFVPSHPTIPGVMDLRKKTAPPEYQRLCGSCWAFSTTNSLRSMLMLEGKDPGPLSKNYLLLNAGPIHESGCNGGDFRSGRNMINGRGPCLESLSPYTGSDRNVIYPKNAPVAATASKWVVVGDGYHRPTAQELAVAIWNQGKGACLSVDIAADRTIESYHSGVITRTTSMRSNHMVRVVGYNAGASVDRVGNATFTDQGDWKDPRGAYFIMRNSWDLDWGIDGDCFIAYGVNNLAEIAMLFLP